jgi:hypothetical protein
MHADRLDSGMLCHGKHRTTAPGEPRRCGGPYPIRVHPRASACIRVEPSLLAALRAALSGNVARPLRASQNPLHLYRSPKCLAAAGTAPGRRKRPPSARRHNLLHRRTVRLTGQASNLCTGTHRPAFYRSGWSAR